MKKTSKYQGQVLPQESMINIDPELRKHRKVEPNLENQAEKTASEIIA
jgi:hypothetical protein